MQSSSEDEEYEVEEILEKKIKKGEVSYKVKWKGYPISESSNLFICVLTVVCSKRGSQLKI